MIWQSVSITLACNCPGAGTWDTTDPGDPQRCSTHGETEVRRVGRIYEARGSRDAKFGEVSDAS